MPFLEKGLVQQTGWLDGREFLVAVAIGMISPGPVVITATFVGYLVAGFWGALVSTIGIFLPSFLLDSDRRRRSSRAIARNPNVQGFVKGAYAAAIGTILGACVLLGKIAIGDWLTALVAARQPGRAVPLEGQQPAAGRGDGVDRPGRVSAAAAGLGVRQMRSERGEVPDRGDVVMSKLLRFALLLGLCALMAPAVAANEDDWQKVGRRSARPASAMPGGVYRVGLPRTDIKVDARRRRAEARLCARRLARLREDGRAGAW